jgi:hypothetical protein
MTRFLAAAVLLTALTVPAVACEWNKSASTGTQSNAVASRAAGDHATTSPSNSAKSTSHPQS